jgi:hypothetical protein
MRPVLAGIVTHYVAMQNGAPLLLWDVAEMNDALDARAENDRRARDAVERAR